jgi:hypothetical protein
MNVSTIVFIIILIIIIIILIRYYVTNNTVLTKLSDATVQQTISASSLGSTNSVGSNNFAFSIWFYIANWNYRYGEPKLIYGRMNNTTGNLDPSTSINEMGPCPLVSLGAITNDLDIALAYFNDTTSSVQTSVINCPIKNIPIQKWVNLIISVYGKTLDTYINGKLVKTCVLPGVAKVNKDANVYVTPLGGFEGSTTKLAYYANSLNPEEAWNIYKQGYGNNSLSNLFGRYQLNLSLSQNGTEEASITI